MAASPLAVAMLWLLALLVPTALVCCAVRLLASGEQLSQAKRRRRSARLLSAREEAGLDGSPSPESHHRGARGGGSGSGGGAVGGRFMALSRAWVPLTHRSAYTAVRVRGSEMSADLEADDEDDDAASCFSVPWIQGAEPAQPPPVGATRADGGIDGRGAEEGEPPSDSRMAALSSMAAMLPASLRDRLPEDFCERPRASGAPGNRNGCGRSKPEFAWDGSQVSSTRKTNPSLSVLD